MCVCLIDLKLRSLYYIFSVGIMFPIMVGKVMIFVVLSQVLSDIREKMNLPGDCRATRLSPKKTISSSIPSSMKNDPAYEILLLNNIKMTTITNKFLATNWLKVCMHFVTIIFHTFVPFKMLLIK